MRIFLFLLGVSGVVSLSALAADGATLQTVDSNGKATSDAYALKDVRCRFEDNKLSILSEGEKSVQFSTSIANFAVLPTTRGWKGQTQGAATETLFMDEIGGRWKATNATRCEIALERDEAQTKLDVKCTNLTDADVSRLGLQHVVAAKLVCANAKLAAR